MSPRGDSAINASILLKSLVKRVSNVHRPGSLPDIFLFTTARSGSTLLSEGITSQPGLKFVNEPLDVRDPVVARESGFQSFKDLLPHPRRQELLFDYVTRLRNNKIPYANPNPFSRDRALITNRICFKILHGCKDLANWFRDTFSGQVLVLYRHPIAVTLSRRVLPALPFYLDNEAYMALFTAEQRQLARRIIEQESPLEQGVLDWCLQNAPLLFCQDTQNWSAVCYEDIVLRPEQTFASLARELKLPKPERMVQSAARPSRTVRYSAKDSQAYFKGQSPGDDKRYLVDKWKNKVSPEDEARAFDILEAFGIDLYTRGQTEPSRRPL